VGVGELPVRALRANGQNPPLPFPDDHFDLVFSSSVFTHIDEHAQDLWLAELRRVTQPGACCS
jgi:ubiquinone/menaquinone biosynthesis C-methylase UbiE